MITFADRFNMFCEMTDPELAPVTKKKGRL